MMTSSEEVVTYDRITMAVNLFDNRTIGFNVCGILRKGFSGIIVRLILFYILTAYHTKIDHSLSGLFCCMKKTPS